MRTILARCREGRHSFKIMEAKPGEWNGRPHVETVLQEAPGLEYWYRINTAGRYCNESIMMLFRLGIEYDMEENADPTTNKLHFDHTKLVGKLFSAKVKHIPYGNEGKVFGILEDFKLAGEAGMNKERAAEIKRNQETRRLEDIKRLADEVKKDFKGAYVSENDPWVKKDNEDLLF
jgi:hypothetical protein